MNELINLGNGQFVKITMLKGEKGTNIATITKTGTSGLVDTYTVTLTDGSTTTFEVTNGNSVDHVEKTSTVGSVDTYTIYLTDGTSAGTFTVNNAVASIEQDFSTTSTNPLMNKTLTNAIAGVETGSTASKTYYKNDIILRNDSLYQVTTTVATGTAWADGVNITETTLGALIGSINNSLTANSNHFYFDYKNGNYGYNTSANRGADTFHPFSGNLSETTLWSNPSPTSNFGSQVVNLSGLSSYKYLKVVFRISTSDSTEVESMSSYSFFSSTSWSGVNLAASSSSNQKWRIWHRPNDLSAGIEFSNGKMSAGGTITNSASTMIPIKISGLK